MSNDDAYVIQWDNMSDINWFFVVCCEVGSVEYKKIEDKGW